MGSQVINVNSITNKYESLKEEQSSFFNTSYYTFKNSYLRNCDDQFVRRMELNLRRCYEDIGKNYESITKWLNAYLTDVKASDMGIYFNKDTIYTKNDTIRSYYTMYLKPIEELKYTYSMDSFAIDINEVENLKGEGSFVDTVGTAVAGTFEGIGKAVEGVIDSVATRFVDTASNGLRLLGDTYSLVKGIFTDQDMAQTGADILKLEKDGIKYIAGLMFGDFANLGASKLESTEAGKAVNSFLKANAHKNEDMEQVINKIWKGTKAFVSIEHVKNFFDENVYRGETIYDEEGNIIGYKGGLKDTANFELTRGIGNGIGQVSFTVATAAMTGGGTLAEMGITYGIGSGQGIEKSFTNGASVDEALGYGALKGTWEAAQWGIGKKISGSKFFDSRLLNSGTRIVLDGVDSGLDSFMYPLIDMNHKFTEEQKQEILANINYDQNGVQIQNKRWEDLTFEEKYKALYEYNGGTAGLLTNIGFGAGMSAFGEITNLGEMLDPKKRAEVNLVDRTQEIQKNLKDLDITENDISALLAATDYKAIERWNPQKLNEFLHRQFDSKYGYDVVEKVTNTIHIIDESEWGNVIKSRGLGSTTTGFVDANSELYLPSNADMHTAVHESLHKFSELSGRKIEYNGKLYKVTGIRGIYADGQTSNIANEALTEFLSSKIHDGLLYKSMYDIENAKLWNRIDDAMNTVYGVNSNKLFNAYLDNDTDFLREFFGKYSKKASYDDFVLKMNTWYNNPKYLENVVKQIEKSTYKDTHSILKKIKGFFEKKAYSIMESKLKNDIEITQELDVNAIQNRLKNDIEITQELDVNAIQNRLKNDIEITQELDVNAIQNKLNENINVRSSIDDRMYFENLTSSQYKDLLDHASKFNGLELKQNILSSLDSKMSDIQRMRKLYIELNSKLNYDNDYVQFTNNKKAYESLIKKIESDENSKNLQDIYHDKLTNIQNKQMVIDEINEKMNFENLNSSKVVCTGWAFLYKELLIDAGINPNDITVYTGSHCWVEVKLPNHRILMADATDVFDLSSLDVANCKAGLSTKGFMIVSDEYRGQRPREVYSEIKKKNKIDSTLDIMNSNMTILDTEIGYISDGMYSEELIKKNNDLFKGQDMNSIGNSKLITQKFIDMEIPENMDGYDLQAYMLVLKKNKLLTQGMKPKMLDHIIGNEVEICCEITMPYGDSQKILIYGKSFGKKIFDSEVDADAFKRSLNIV